MRKLDMGALALGLVSAVTMTAVALMTRAAAPIVILGVVDLVSVWLFVDAQARCREALDLARDILNASRPQDQP